MAELESNRFCFKNTDFWRSQTLPQKEMPMQASPNAFTHVSHSSRQSSPTQYG